MRTTIKKKTQNVENESRSSNCKKKKEYTHTHTNAHTKKEIRRTPKAKLRIFWICVHVKQRGEISRVMNEKGVRIGVQTNDVCVPKTTHFKPLKSQTTNYTLILLLQQHQDNNDNGSQYVHLLGTRQLPYFSLYANNR